MIQQPKVLVLFAGSYGHTREILDQILDEEDAKITVREIREFDPAELPGFDKVALGGSIRSRKLHPAVVQFADNQKNILLATTLALFITGLDQEQMKVQLENGFSEDLRNHSSCSVWLGGELDLRRLNPFVRFVIRRMSGGPADRSWRNSQGILLFREFVHGRPQAAGSLLADKKTVPPR